MKINKIIFTFLTIMCGCYIIKIKVSPIYISFFISLLFVLFNLKKIKLDIGKIDALVVLLVLYTILSNLKYKHYNLILAFIFQFIYFLFFNIITNNISIKNILKCVQKFLFFNLILLFCEMVYRLSYPLLNNLIISDYYVLKKYSFMYPDSNYISIYIISILGLIEYFNVYRHYKKFFIVLLFLTFSKSGILTMILIFFMKKINKKFKILLLFNFIIIIFVYFFYSSNSWTVKSKLYIINEMWQYLSNSPNKLEILFGIGLGNTFSKIGIGPHIIFINIFFELGIIGLIFILMLWGLIYKKSNKNIKKIMFPFIISGLTLMPMYIPYFYVFSSLILRMEYLKNKRNYEKIKIY